MTVIQPNKNNKGIKKLIIYLGLAVLGVIWLEVRTYSSTVTFRHEVASVLEQAEILRVENAELKNQFYALVDQKNLDRLASERGLVKDKNPKWVFASQY